MTVKLHIKVLLGDGNFGPCGDVGCFWRLFSIILVLEPVGCFNVLQYSLYTNLIYLM